MSHPTQGTWNLIFIGWAVQLIGYALMFGLPPILKKRRNKMAASNQRQKLLAAFWKSEHERLWPMLKGGVEKVGPDWDLQHQLYDLGESIQKCGMTTEEAFRAIGEMGFKGSLITHEPKGLQYIIPMYERPRPINEKPIQK